MGDPDGTITIDVDPHTKHKQQRPQQWMVVMLNDDYTSMNFVSAILVEYFHKTIEEAEMLTLEIHTKGRAVAGIYTFEVAETKLSLVAAASRQYEFPLKAIIEPLGDV